MLQAIARLENLYDSKAIIDMQLEYTITNPVILRVSIKRIFSIFKSSASILLWNSRRFGNEIRNNVLYDLETIIQRNQSRSVVMGY